MLLDRTLSLALFQRAGGPPPALHDGSPYDLERSLMNCRPGHHDWEILVLDQQGRETRFRRCLRPGCRRWDEMRGVWTAIGAPPLADELEMA